MKLKIMSFNIRYDNPGDGLNSFSNRYKRTLDVIEKEAPDIIGFQEVTESMRATVKNELTGYEFAGCGRDANYHGESTLIAFRKGIFEFISCENVWLSKTPTVPGSRYHEDGHSGCCRMYTMIRLKHDEIEKPFRVVNTHLDHEGGRLLESKQLTDALSMLDEKFIMTGDFNAEPYAPEIKNVTEALKDKGVIDCTAKLGPTFHAFGLIPKEKCIKIDYIFTDGKCDEAYAVADEGKDGLYYSDHNAVCALIEL